MKSNDKLSFIIYAPFYARNSAGIYALYKLALDLKQLGHFVSICIWNSNILYNPIFNVPIFPMNISKCLIKCYPKTVVIYPEVVPGNPLEANQIMRWVMNKPGCFGVGDTTFSNLEKIFMYGTSYNQYITNNKIVGELTTPTIDIDLFKYDKNIQKTDITIYVGKQKFENGVVDDYDNIITRTSPSHEEVAKILKRTKVLYSFDCLTNIVNEARLCGCEVIYIPNSEQQLDINKNEFTSYGLHLLSNKNELKYDHENIANIMMQSINAQNLLYKKQLEFMINVFNSNE